MYSEILGQLTAFGDRPVEEITYAPEQICAVNRRNTDLIRERVWQLSARHPEWSGLFDAFVAMQDRETQRLGREVGEAIWILQRVHE